MAIKSNQQRRAVFAQDKAKGVTPPSSGMPSLHPATSSQHPSNMPAAGRAAQEQSFIDAITKQSAFPRK